MDGWMLLKRIPLPGITPFYGPLNNAREVAFNPPEIYGQLEGEIEPWKTVKGMAMFECSNTQTPGSLPLVEAQPSASLYWIRLATASSKRLRLSHQQIAMDQLGVFWMLRD